MVSYNPDLFIGIFSHKWVQERVKDLAEESPKTHTSMRLSSEERRSHLLLLRVLEEMPLSFLWTI